MKKVIVVLIVIALLCGCVAGFTGCKNKQKEGVISIRNLYFENWSAEQGDAITKYMEEKFGVTFETSSYSFNNWTAQVTGDVNGNQVPDVFQADVKPENLNNTYIYWAEGGVVKALPDELLANETSSRWPYLQSMIKNTKDIEALLYKGKLYGIPVSRNVNKAEEAEFAPFTYIYRRDIAKNLEGFQEDDVYTWEQFETLLASFKARGMSLGDAEWPGAYPSIVNYYKTATHCFTFKNGQVVNNYFTDEYMAGLNKAKSYVDKKWYYQGQLQSAGKSETDPVEKRYYDGTLGIFYDNFSLANYLKVRKQMLKTNGINESNIDDATALMKVMGPTGSNSEGKYALEEQEDWFSMSFLNADISNSKMEKILDIMNWLISPEGTEMALYGIEGVDYEKNGDNVTLLESNLWAKNNKGEYIDSPNGARYLRYMVTLGHDITGKDPVLLASKTQKQAYTILKSWEDFMKEANAAGKLTILKEDPRIKWMTTSKKLEYQGKILDDANTKTIKYAFSSISYAEYERSMTDSRWREVLAEINANLNK
ncbi:MAG TPA: hypothetical protein DCG79_03890 [Clostridiales bacterium]|nr:hypothetical protein [Clostridiales bacterium]